MTLRSGFLVAIASAVLVAAAAWLALYARHLDGAPAPALPQSRSADALPALFDVFEQDVRPTLERKCAACHTDTAARPFFYDLPVLARFTRPHTERTLTAARRQFDFSGALDEQRPGAAMEAVLRLAATARDNDMPPVPYRWLRPHHRLNARERAALVGWAEHTAAAMIDRLATAGPADLPALTADGAAALARDIAAACPPAATGDVAARDACADALDRVAPLRTHVSDPFLWGGQAAPGDYKPYHAQVTRFNPRLWRRYYLSLFTYDGDYTIDDDGELLALRLAARFRDRMPDGEYPYPFWHSADKWRKYNEAAELILVLRQGRIVASFRSAARRDPPAAFAERRWDGRWWWGTGDRLGLEPRVTNFRALFSEGNPHVDPLHDAYRQLFLGFRDERCLTCHSPSNDADMRTLEILSSPGHALAARERLVAVFEDNAMPPVTGIADPGKRTRLTRLAGAFRTHADAALAWEGERTHDALAAPSAFRRQTGAPVPR